MKNTFLTLLFLLASLFGYSQIFTVTKYTQLLGEGIVDDRYLENSWIKVEKDTITKHILSKSGKVNKSRWEIIKWIELDSTKNGVLDLGEVIIILAEDGSKIEFSYGKGNSWNGYEVNYLTFYQPYTGIKLRYDSHLSIEGEDTSRPEEHIVKTISNERIRLTNITSKPKTPNDEASIISLKLTIDPQGNVVKADLNRNRTTSTNQRLIDEVINLVIEEVRYKEKPGARFETEYYTVRVSP